MERLTLLPIWPPVRGQGSGFKAFGTGFGQEFGWLDAEVKNGDEGQPLLLFSEKGRGPAREKGGERGARQLDSFGIHCLGHRRSCFFKMNALPADPILSCEESSLLKNRSSMATKNASGRQTKPVNPSEILCSATCRNSVHSSEA